MADAVKIVYSCIYAKVRAGVYHGPEQLYAAIKAALEKYKNAHLKGRDYSRRQQFEEGKRAD